MRDSSVRARRIPSHSCELWDLIDGGFAVEGRDAAALVLGSGWARRWTATWKIAAGEVVCPGHLDDLG